MYDSKKNMKSMIEMGESSLKKGYSVFSLIQEEADDRVRLGVVVANSVLLIKNIF